MGIPLKKYLATLGLAAAGGVLGYFAFFWIASQGFYALVVPGGLLGLAAGLVPNRSLAIAIICGVLALGLGVVTEFRFRPFVADEGFVYFLTHLHQLQPFTWIMIVVGGFIGFWGPFRRMERDSGE